MVYTFEYTVSSNKFILMLLAIVLKFIHSYTEIYKHGIFYGSFNLLLNCKITEAISMVMVGFVFEKALRGIMHALY